MSEHLFPSGASFPQKLDLSGRWEAALDPAMGDALPGAYPFSLSLPGTTSLAGLGPENPARQT